MEGKNLLCSARERENWRNKEQTISGIVREEQVVWISPNEKIPLYFPSHSRFRKCIQHKFLELPFGKVSITRPLHECQPRFMAGISNPLFPRAVMAAFRVRHEFLTGDTIMRCLTPGNRLGEGDLSCVVKEGLVLRAGQQCCERGPT
ncbi:hypothetical protein CEXT_465951 [Caerostris extrusa]|uniref:Uncharacterized protein n=1 Tax=Caerostris extrusa TaxID=172846 RepID=A0AAV4XXG1_CAEEX|nr:hypothetical protein CEXT_465951 [Caerostris extrusa]